MEVGFTSTEIFCSRDYILQIKYLSRYIFREVLIHLNKLNVYPHLDYGDIFHQKYNRGLRLYLTNKLEHIQSAATLAAAVAWKGTGRGKLYKERG